MIKSISLSVLAIGLATAVSAQGAPAIDDSKLVKSVTLADLEVVVASLDHAVVDRDADNVFIIAEDEDGQKYVLDGTACNELGACQGINMFMSYDLTDTISLESLNTASLSYAAVSVWQSGQSVGVSRYVILDGGMTIANIKANIDTLTALGGKVMMMADKAHDDFGDDSGEYANDGTCDDVRFTGEGRSILLTDSHIRKDASDCRAAYDAGTITVK
ncbi:MAG: YbjN domain-containing protein [Alphaproteobacteria bacterium]|nr:YbjN domain-containing protein [Alphaproteobacteria bacterium]